MNDFSYGIAFLVKNKEQILKLCAGPSEAHVVEQTIAKLSDMVKPLPPEPVIAECHCGYSEEQCTRRC